MKYIEMKKVLNDLNKKWELDFVSATSGNCCNTCGDMRTEKETKKWNEAKTYFVIKWFFAGMNYDGKFEEQDELYCKYSDYDKLEEICNDLREKLDGKYSVIKPSGIHSCVKLIKIVS